MIGPTGAGRSHLTLFWVSSVLAIVTLPRPTFADIDFVAPVAFDPAPHVIDGMGNLSINPAPPAGLEATLSGFRYTNVVITYSTVAGDAGNLVKVGWKAGRGFTIVGNPFNGVTAASIGGTISVGPGAALQDVTLLKNTTKVIFGVANSTSIAMAVPPYPGPPVGTFGDGPNFSNLFNLAVGFGGFLEQNVVIHIVVPLGTPAGTTYTFTLPGSFDSSIFPEASVCGDGICEAGEDCESCPEDCAPECDEDADCDDGDACTTDSCADGCCRNEPIECPEGEVCVDGVCTAVPTVSEWGLIIMALLALTAGTIVFARRRRPAVT